MRWSVALALVCSLVGCTETDLPRTPTVQVEFRPAESEPAPGLTEVTVAGINDKLYVHEEVVISNADIVKASALDHREMGPTIRVKFTKSASDAFEVFTRNNIGKPLAIFIDGSLVSAPIIRAPVSGAAMISGDFTSEEAEQIANGIIGK